MNKITRHMITLNADQSYLIRQLQQCPFITDNCPEPLTARNS